MRAPPLLSTRQTMIRPYRKIPSQRLLEIARESRASIRDLEEIIQEFAQRKKDYLLPMYIEVGELLQKTIDEDRIPEPVDGEPTDPTGPKSGYFDWPSTDAPGSKSGFSGIHWYYKEGLLSFVGYRVGRNGIEKEVRQRILDCVFHNDLPQVDSDEYMRHWSEPRSAARLKKMAESLAAFTRNAKRKSLCDYRDAVADWEIDLDYLFRTYYRGHFGFAWPDVQDKD